MIAKTFISTKTFCAQSVKKLPDHARAVTGVTRRQVRDDRDDR
jgi:hypothetical protein